MRTGIKAQNVNVQVGGGGVRKLGGGTHMG